MTAPNLNPTNELKAKLRGFIGQSSTLPTLSVSDALNAYATLKTAFGEQKMSARSSTAIEIQGFFQQYKITKDHQKITKMYYLL